MPWDPRRRDFLALPLAAVACEAAPPLPLPPAQQPPPSIGVIMAEDETGQVPDLPALASLGREVIAALRRRGVDADAAAPGRAPVELRLLVVQWQGPDLLPPAMHDGPLAIARLTERGWRSPRRAAVVHVPRGEAPGRLATAIVEAILPGILESPVPSARPQEITATGRPVRHLGGGVLSVGGDRVDLRAIVHAHDTVADPDVPAATDVTLPGAAPRADGAATITLYQIDPPLAGLPSRQPGIDRGVDFRDPANLVKSTYANAVSPVRTAEPRPVPVASHPIGHFVVKAEVPGFPVILTGMTTIQRSDAELVDLTVGRELGIGGVLLTPQPGRLNAAWEVSRELALRQRRLRIVDGLYFRSVGGRNLGPEYVIADGNVVFARVRVPLANATDAIACFAELVARGGHNRFGSLLNRTFKGTGAGCAAFAMSWLQAAGVIPFVTDPPEGAPPAEVASLGPLEFWRAFHSRVRIPWAHLGCDERLGAARPVAARYTLYDLLLHGERQDFVGAATEGLAERVRDRFGTVAGTAFEFGIQSPLRGLAVVVFRRDPFDRGDYRWGGDGVDVPFWENARFSAWVRAAWRAERRHPLIRLAREGRFIGLDIDATAAPRQQEPFYAAADRREEALRAGRPRAETCEAVFARGLE